MAVANVLQTYGDASIVEDVVRNSVEIISSHEDFIYSMLGKTTAESTVHSYLTDTLRTAASAAVAEGADFTASATTTPSRLTNIVEHIAINYKVTRTQQAVSHYHGEDELSRQTMKALKDWTQAAEFDLVRSTLTSGLSGTTPTMSGIIQAISKATNTTVHTSAVAWSASILEGLMKANWDNSNGDVATDLFMGSHLRKLTDGFAQKTNTVVTGDVRTVVNTTDLYETAFGVLRVHTHRLIQQSADATARVLAINPEKLKIAVLREPHVQTDLARSGDYDNYAVVGAHTLEVRNQDSNWFASGFLKS